VAPRSATSAQLRFQLSPDTEPAYDHLIVEAHTAGEDDWTTLPDVNGGTSTRPPAECTGDSFLISLHPFLRHYLGGTDCTAPGSTGRWNSFTGTSDGWKQVAFDLTPYAGREVELAISYVTDPATGRTGAFVDDTRIVIDGVVGPADGFEEADSSWTPSEPPEGSPSGQDEWQIGEGLVNFYAATSTPDTLLLGFGLEQLADDADRVELVDAALDGLLTQD